MASLPVDVSPRPFDSLARTAALAVLVIALAVLGEWYVALARVRDATCGTAEVIARLTQLPEASGLALSRHTPGLLWAINDSAEPVLWALDTRGTVRGKVRVTGAEVGDWEDVTVASCDHGTCVYIADIGDNDERRRDIVIYRVPEPEPGAAATAAADVIRASYPDGPHDAEGLFITSDGAAFVVTKEKPSRLFRFPAPLAAGTTMLQEVGRVPVDSITDAEASPDGRTIFMRTNSELMIFPSQGIEAGLSEHSGPVDLSRAGEAQGEGVAGADDGTIYLTGESGGKGGTGTFAKLRCRPPAR